MTGCAGQWQLPTGAVKAEPDNSYAITAEQATAPTAYNRVADLQ